MSSTKDRALMAANWLHLHSMEVVGVTHTENPAGVCVVEHFTTVGGGGYALPQWVPANKQALRDFMNY